MDPYALLAEHPDLTLLITRLPGTEKGRWYPDQGVIVIDDRLTQAERRCTLMHELVHRMRGDLHVDDEVYRARQERYCHETVARLLIPYDRLRAALEWGRDEFELAEELWVDVDTLRARIRGLSAHESRWLLADLKDSEDQEVVA